MGKVIKMPCLVESKSNIKQLKMLIEQYVFTDKKEVLNKIKKEQKFNH